MTSSNSLIHRAQELRNRISVLNWDLPAIRDKEVWNRKKAELDRCISELEQLQKSIHDPSSAERR